jgi:hypothetical protein
LQEIETLKNQNNQLAKEREKYESDLKEKDEIAKKEREEREKL